MCEMITSVTNSAREAVWNASTGAVKSVSDAVNYCGRAFEKLTVDVLGDTTAARIVQRVVYGAPWAVAALFAPAYLQLTALAVYAMIHVVHDIAGDPEALPFSQTTYRNAFTGVATAFIYRAGEEIVKLATQQKANGIAIAINLIIASLLISKATSTPAPTFGSAHKVPQVAPDVCTETPLVAPTATTTV